MTHVLHRSLLNTPIRAARGDGVYVVDAEGKRYLDGCGGAAVSCLGHSHPAIVDAVQKQAQELPYAHTAFFTTDILEELAGELIAEANGMDKVLFLCGGSEAMEAALKLSRQYFVEAGQPEREVFIARRQSYHGNTLGALGVGGNEWRRQMFAPLLNQGHHIAPCFEYREKTNGESAEAYGQRVANELEAKINEVGPGRVAAFVAETVVGATAGAVAAVPGYFRRIREICDRYGVHLILDEIMCGSGRTGTYFAHRHEGIVPDMVALAKGLASGYQPIGALLCKGEITDAIRAGSGFFQHGHTFMGHVTAVAAALATFKVVKGENLLENVNLRGESIRAGLRETIGDHPNVGDVRGRGLFIGVEFVADKQTRAPLDPADGVHKKVQQAALERGLMVYGMGGTIDGCCGNHVLIAPAFTINESHEAELIDKFSAAISDIMPSS